MERFLSRVAFSLAAAVAAIMLVAVATIFLCGALYLFLVSVSVAPPAAALLVGLAGLIVAALIIFLARSTPQWRQAARTNGGAGSADLRPAGNIDDLAAELGALAARRLGSRVQAHPYRAFVVALLTGLAVGGSSELRDVLKKTLDT